MLDRRERDDAAAPPHDRPREARGTYAVMNAMRALERLAFQPHSAPELAASLQIDQRTVRRLLRRLVVEGYVVAPADHHRRYRASLRLASLGRQLIERAALPRAWAPSVARLAVVTGATAHLWVPSYQDVVCVLHVDAAAVGRLPEPMLRELRPAHASAGGKVLLAHREQWRASLLERRLHRYTEHTITDVRDLVHELRRIRARGHASEVGELDLEQATIAAPLHIGAETPAAVGVSLDAPTWRVTEQHALIAAVRAAAAGMTDRVGEVDL